MLWLREGIRTLTIANGGTTTNELPLRGRLVVGFQTPSALTGTIFTFQGSMTTGGTYTQIFDAQGSPVSINVSPSQFIGISGLFADAIAAAPFIEIVSNAAEGAARSIIVALK